MTLLPKKTILGTRGSALALWQANEVAGRLTVPWEIRVIETSGDRILDAPLQGPGRIDKGFFTKEIQDRLLEGEIDLAVHSLKDLPTEPPPGLALAAFLPRGPVNDILVVHPDWLDSSAAFPVKSGARVGAGSLRRQALLRIFAGGLEPALIRGNVPTRIRKCDGQQYGAIVLAQAGVHRLQADVSGWRVFALNPELWLPAPGQGAIAVEVRAGDRETCSAVAQLDHPATRRAVSIERQLLANFQGGCSTAFGCLAEKQDDRWRVRLGVDLPDKGWQVVCFEGSEAECSAQDACTLAARLAPQAPGEKWLCRPLA